MATNQREHVRRLEPMADGWQRFAWDGGAFDMAHRQHTEVVEGTICTPHHLVLVTIGGSARKLEVRTDDGHRYDGPDRCGAVSLVPAHCERQIRLLGVRAAWASIALRPELMDEVAGATDDGVPACADFAPFTNAEDGFLAGLIGEVARLHGVSGKLDPLYCDAMTHALAHYLVRRYGRSVRRDYQPVPLPPWRTRRIAEYIDAHIGDEIRIAALAQLVGLSAGHLHRAFRATTGVTPLAFVNEQRIQRALKILATENISITELAFRVGFVSPSHFTRTFRRITGSNPSQVRRM